MDTYSINQRLPTIAALFLGVICVLSLKISMDAGLNAPTGLVLDLPLEELESSAGSRTVSFRVQQPYYRCAVSNEGEKPLHVMLTSAKKADVLWELDVEPGKACTTCGKFDKNGTYHIEFTGASQTANLRGKVSVRTVWNESMLG